MMFENLKQQGNCLSFDINEMDVCLVNGIRRIIFADVPSIAISFDPNSGKNHDVKVTKNTGSLHNEFLCHRLSLVPIHFNADEVENFQHEKYKFVLKMKNESDGMMDVTTQHIEVYDEVGNKYGNNLRDRLFPPNMVTGDYILLTKLKPNLFNNEAGDEIDIEAYASKNVGSSHIRWTPVSKCCYHNNIDENESKMALDKHIKENANSDLTVDELAKRFNLLDAFRYFKKNKYGEPCSFRFEMETECNLTCKYIFKKAIEILSEKVRNFSDNVSTLNGVKITQQGMMYYITVSNENHTLGNLIQAIFYNEFVRGEDKSVSYIGYYQPHPLESDIVFKIKTDSNINTIVTRGCQRIIDYLTNVTAEWDKFVSGS